MRKIESAKTLGVDGLLVGAIFNRGSKMKRDAAHEHAELGAEVLRTPLEHARPGEQFEDEAKFGCFN